jgi:predicted ATPase/DNA-binding SARP family transcriptional activator
VRVRILGPLQVEDRGRALEIDSPKERALLEVLSLHSPEVVSVDSLVLALWGEDPPATARKSLQSHVSRLRAALPEGVITTDATGYRLELPRGQADVHRFEDLVRAGQQALEGGEHRWAIELFDEALAEWRGTPLADVVDSPARTGQRTRLEELRAAVVNGRVDAHLGVGLHHEMVAELEVLVAEHPLDEGLWSRLVLALYRSSRRGDALAAVGRARTELREQLGIDPSPQLAELEHRVLEDDPELLPQPDAPQLAVPLPITAFVGRVRQVREVRKLLAEHRLVSLLGPGGVGKSRLAIEVARTEAANHADGVWWADMADVRDADGVVAALLKAMRIAMPPGVPAQRVLESYLATREVLLLLDNAERLVEGVGKVLVDLLAAAPGLRVLVTSRAPIGLVGEQRYVVPPMDADGDDAGDSEAVRLFVDRWADHGLAPEADDLASIEAMCDLVDRLPLGIELAAAAAADSGVEVALTELRSHHGLLDAPAGSRPAMPGVSDHGGLVAVLSSTTELLTPPQRELLGRLGTFGATFDRDAVEAVAGSPNWESDLRRLRDLALVSAQESPTGRRLRLLDTTAAYARATAPAEVTLDATRRHAQHYRELAVVAGPSMDGPDEGRTAERLEVECRNLDAAIEWYLEHRPADVLAFARALGRLWYLHEDMASTADRLEALISAAAAAGESDPGEEGWAWVRLAWPRFLSGDFEGGVEAMERAERLCGEAGDELGLSQATKGQAHMALLGSADTETALGLYRRSLAHARRAQQPLAVAWVLVEAAQSLILADRTDDEVHRMLDEAQELFEQAGDQYGLSHLWMDRMLAAYAVGDLDSANRACEAGIEQQRMCGNRMYEQVLRTALGAGAVHRGDLATARRELTDAVTMAHEDQNLMQLGIALQGMAVLAAAERDSRRSARLRGAAGTLCPYWPLFERRYGPLLEPVRVDLGHSWDHEVAAGAQLSPDRAVALALD